MQRFWVYLGLYELALEFHRVHFIRHYFLQRLLYWFLYWWLCFFLSNNNRLSLKCVVDKHLNVLTPLLLDLLQILLVRLPKKPLIKVLLLILLLPKHLLLLIDLPDSLLSQPPLLLPISQN